MGSTWNLLKRVLCNDRLPTARRKKSCSFSRHFMAYYLTGGIMYLHTKKRFRCLFLHTVLLYKGQIPGLLVTVSHSFLFSPRYSWGQNTG